jgi:hypothetical protein
MSNKHLRCSCLALWLAFTLPLAGAEQPPEVKKALDAHMANAQKIKTIHYKYETFFEDNAQKLGDTEVWQSGPRQKVIERNWVEAIESGLVDRPEGLFTMTAYTDGEVKSIRGWDPVTSIDLPLKFYRNPRHFEKILGQIRPRDPADRFPGGHFLLVGGLTLAEVANAAELVVVPAKQEGHIGLQVKASPKKFLQDLRVDLDPVHGHGISYLQSRSSGENTITQFKTTDDIWMPEELTGSLDGRKWKQRLTICEVNPPLKPQDLDFDFLEGSKVDDKVTGKFHIWGVGGPQMTFDREEERNRYLMRDVKTIVAGILVGLGLAFVLLFIWRWRRRKSTVPQMANSSYR